MRCGDEQAFKGKPRRVTAVVVSAIKEGSGQRWLSWVCWGEVMDQDLAALLQRHLVAENAHDIEGTLATLHRDCLFEDHATGQVWHGHAGAADHYRQWWQAFDVTVERRVGQCAYWGSDSVYVAEATWQGTHIGDFLGIPATGKTITQAFVVFVTFRDGLMAGEEFYYDLASLARQLGSERIPELASLEYRPGRQ
jgi:steroid delta-isomerase-like uncharacterized protein